MIASESSGGRGGSQEVDLNIAPIIDCFTVLIAFMLASASYLSIGILDAGVSAGATAATDTTPPPIQITLELAPDSKLTLKVTGKAQSTRALNLADLTPALSELKAKWPNVSALTLNATDLITYKDVVKTMEVARKTIPVVLLGGF